MAFGMRKRQKEWRKFRDLEISMKKLKKESGRNIKRWCYSWMGHCMITFYYN